MLFHSSFIFFFLVLRGSSLPPSRESSLYRLKTTLGRTGNRRKNFELHSSELPEARPSPVPPQDVAFALLPIVVLLLFVFYPSLQGEKLYILPLFFTFEKEINFP